MIQAAEAEVPGCRSEPKRRKSREGRGTLLVPRCPPQTSHGLSRDQNRDSNLKMKINANYYYYFFFKIQWYRLVQKTGLC
jgi:hypothetical protein